MSDHITSPPPPWVKAEITVNWSSQPSKAQSICTTLAQRIPRWANIVQMLYNCLRFNTGRVAYIKCFNWTEISCKTRNSSSFSTNCVSVVKKLSLKKPPSSSECVTAAPCGHSSSNTQPLALTLTWHSGLYRWSYYYQDNYWLWETNRLCIWILATRNQFPSCYQVAFSYKTRVNHLYLII